MLLEPENQWRDTLVHADSKLLEDAKKSSSNLDLEAIEVPRVLSLEPQSLLDVGNSFIAVANACGEQQRGLDLHKQFLADLKAISDAVSDLEGATSAAPSNGSGNGSSGTPKVFILEWLDPPFDAGHWAPEVLSVCAHPSFKDSYVSKPRAVFSLCLVRTALPKSVFYT